MRLRTPKPAALAATVTHGPRNTMVIVDDAPAMLRSYLSSAPRHGAQGEPATVREETHETAGSEDSASPVQLNRGFGRPPLVRVLGLTGPVGEELRLFARRMVLAHNRTEDAGSYSLALELAAKHPVAPEAFRAWVAGRKDRHSIPPSIRAWLDVSAAVQRHHRNPTEAGLRGVYCPDALRVNHRTGERLRAGERFSADDGSVNFVLMVPWPWGGCPCSDRYGVKVGRFQLLVMHDDGSGYVPHFTWIARASQGYRAEDIAAFLHTPFARLGCWETALLERGSWESHRVTELLAAAGVERDTAYEPQQKLVEMAHHLECTNPQIHAECLAFRASRMKPGEKPRPLAEITGNYGHSYSEIAIEDEWQPRGTSAYAGRVYSADLNATEILTMGMERMYLDPINFARQDPDYFKFILRVLRPKS